MRLARSTKTRLAIAVSVGAIAAALLPIAVLADNCDGNQYDCFSQMVGALWAAVATAGLVGLAAVGIKAIPYVRQPAGRAASKAVIDRAVSDHNGDVAAALFDLISGVNPAGGSKNCQLVVGAVDGRLGGESTATAGITTDSSGHEISPQLGGKDVAQMNQSEYNPVTSYEEVTQLMVAAGSGARGVVDIGDPPPNADGAHGHVFNVVNVGGQIWRIDGQQGPTAWIDPVAPFQAPPQVSGQHGYEPDNVVRGFILTSNH